MNVKATAVVNGAKITWNEVPGAEYYIVYTYDEVTGFAEKGRPTTGALTVTGLENGKTYGFLIRAYGSGALSDFSTIAYATPNGINKPTNVNVVSNNVGEAYITWDEVVGAEYYIVYSYDPTSGFLEKGRPNVNSLELSNLASGSELGIIIRAYGFGSLSDFSDIDHAVIM